ncbi:hypothetical protein GCK72_025991 [Caenorhabditis remanei]|uniref:Protein kinase domain-containing protein n=1 Tax=Caenorhabditis remanei TaxID=31234 RepID=A0A6A5G4A7_CAERE|nr:hypothetical protein GCK72_025990 [Caenorhabditis remanei]XP_053580165.1 hypothetical protein GCK72_025991 [Caenorhabditis remanei]KAF1749522.1 hypothetical protein GCK72_025990 [Caenorhabditis remanei]KAF1749523.1 hypothetical protein GCK72_025991 [Caenorhabditis remanei]
MPVPDDKINAFLANELNYVQIKYLGKGCFGNVSVVRSKIERNPKNIVMKRVCKLEPGYKDEIEIHEDLSKGKHSHIIEMYSAEILPKHAVIMMECAEDGNLRDLIRCCLDLNTIQLYFKQMVFGLQYIHSKGYCHRDIKAENLLLCNGVIKIADFGLACSYRDAKGIKKVSGGNGTRKTAAPENWVEEKVDGPALDIWSVGIVLIDMVTATPWAIANPSEDQAFAKYSKNPKKWTCDAFQVIEAKDKKLMKLVRSILKCNPGERPTLEKIIQNEWCQKADWDEEKQGDMIQDENQDVAKVRLPVGSAPVKKRTYEQKFEEELMALPAKRGRRQKKVFEYFHDFMF